MAKADIGLWGLAVMGENLVLNMESKGFTVAVFNRTIEKTTKFSEGRAKGKNIIPAYEVKDFISSLSKPRKVMLMVKAGKPVDMVIEQVLPFMDKGDIIIDGGNSYFGDTIRRYNQLKEKGLLCIGTGVSGGEEGALKGPSIMPGGSKEAYKAIEPIFTKIAAQVDGQPCCAYIGDDGAGHFVKMVHNGIEYGDMQLICEAYNLMKHGLGMSALQMHKVFKEWNNGVLDSYLIQITADILAKKIGYRVIDREILEHVAKDKKLSEQTVAFFNEQYLDIITEYLSWIAGEKAFAKSESTHNLFRAILSFATLEPSIFVGRGTYLVLPREQVLAVRFIASDEYRIKRLARILNIKEKEAADKLNQVDKEQRRFFKQVYGKKTITPDEFDMVINYDYIREPQWAAEIVARAFKEKFGIDKI